MLGTEGRNGEPDGHTEMKGGGLMIVKVKVSLLFVALPLNLIIFCFSGPQSGPQKGWLQCPRNNWSSLLYHGPTY